MHFHVCVVDGVFEATESGVIFHPITGIDAAAVAQVQATLRCSLLRAFVGRGLLESFDAKEMLTYQHSGFSVDAGVCIEAHDRAGLERLLRLRGVASAVSNPWWPPLWDDIGDAQMGESVEVEPDWDMAAQPAPDYEVDQRINW